jgi:hypothetical protein
MTSIHNKIHSCKRGISTMADWRRLPRERRTAGLVSRLTDWARTPNLFENDEQVKGALTLAYQQYMDGMGRDLQHWVGITDQEFRQWRDTGQLPNRLRVRRRK